MTKGSRGAKIVAILILGLLVTPPASAQTVQERLPTCLACHGENGQSQTPEVPSLGGQQAFYVTVQLLMFRERMRVVDPMNDMTKGLTDDDLRNFADIIAKLPPPQPPDDPVDAARIERGRALVEQNHCNVCHTPNSPGRTTSPASPTSARNIWSRRCAATRTIPAAATTNPWRDVIAAITDEQILDLAYYIARCKVSAQAFS